MPPPTISDGTYAKADITLSWGISPGSAVIQKPGDVRSSYPAGSEVTTNTGGTTFHGMVVKVSLSASGLSGETTQIDIADNRIHLQMDPIKGVWNITEVRADNPLTPGIDRQRRYWSIVPDDHRIQRKTWSDTPFTARQIVDQINADIGVAFAWTISDPDDLLESPVYEINANDGAKVGSVLAQICEQLGILLTVTGYNTLLFARKGTGDEPYLDPETVSAYGTGTAMSHVDTHVEVVGGRNVVQHNTLTLEPWWNAAYEIYLGEGPWLQRVQELWGDEWAAEPTDEAKAAFCGAKARTVTLREYVDKTGVGAYADYQWWGEVSRMEMPVWLYLRDIVFKAYRVPRDYTFSVPGTDELVPLESVEMHESLLAAMDWEPTTGDLSVKAAPSPPYPQWYPQDRMFVIAQAQPISVIDPRGHKMITAESQTAQRSIWQSKNNYTIDARPESFGIIFDDMLFVDDVDNPLILFPNQDKDGIAGDPAHPLFNVAVPNADYSITAANVRATIAWKVEKYLKSFGSGPRWGTAHAEGIAQHRVYQGGILYAEVPYPGGDLADDKAEAFAAGIILQDQTYDSGPKTRKGASGTELTGMIDRVTVSVNFEGGITETVDLTKERQPTTYFNERSLDRAAQQHDLYKDQRALQNEVWAMRSYGEEMRAIHRNRPDPLQAHADIQALMSAPIGNPHAGTQVVDIGATSRPAGQPMWRDPATGGIDASGVSLAGVVVSDASSGRAALATQGVVPVRVKGPFAAGDAVGVNGSNAYSEKNGERPVGTAQVDYTGTDTVLAPVRLTDEPDPFRREFDISVLSHSGLTVKVIDGTWMGIRKAGATDAGTPGAYHTLTVANGDKIYLKLDYHELTSAGTLDILAGATVPADVPSDGLFYRQLATVSVASGIISTPQTLWGPLEYAGRYQHLREFDVSPLRDSDPSVRIMAGTWMGIKGTGGLFSPGRGEYFALYVADGDTVYVKLDRYASALTYHAGVLPADAPEQGLFYTAIATISIAAGRITVEQTRWGPLEYLPGAHREFHIEPSSAYYVAIYNGTLFGSLPAGFSVNDSPIFTLAVANNDKIYAKVTWDRRVKANGDIVSTITTRTIEAAAAVPADDNLTATRHYLLATVTLGAGNIPVVSQSRWGPIDDLPGTAYSNYYTSGGSTAQTDFWDLTLTSKGKDTAAVDLAPTYDSIQLLAQGFARFVKSGNRLLIFVRNATLNSQGQITYVSAETKVFDEAVVN